MIALKRILLSDCELYDWAVELLKTSFPACERRDDAFQRQIMSHADYRLVAIIDDGQPVGVMGYFDAPKFVYFENFCVCPDKRNCGYGSQVLSMLTQNLNKPFVLEAELPVDQLTKRRIAFYKRNGMTENPYPHVQPHYRKTDSDLRLVVLTYGKQLTQAQYDAFRNYLDVNVDVKSPHYAFK